MRKKALSSAELEAMRRGLVDVGLDRDYWSSDDIAEMERWGYGAQQMVDLALRRQGKTRATA